MEQLIFSPSDLLNLSFSVNIDGTNAIPSEVRCVINNNGNLIVSKANQIEDKYYCSFNLNDVQNLNSTCLLTIEVILNNKIYIPIKRNISIVNNAIVNFDKPLDTAITVVRNASVDVEKNDTSIEIAQDEIKNTEFNISSVFKIEEDKIDKKTIKFDKIIKEEQSSKNIDFKIPISEAKIGTKIKRSNNKIKPREQFDFKITEGKIIFK